MDDFRFTIAEKEIVNLAIKLLNENRVKIDYIKELYFRGVDIEEKREYIHLYATTYINKLAEKINFVAH